jgi:hypothetical protein
MRNPTTADFGTVPQKFLFRLNWPFFWPAAGLKPETDKSVSDFIQEKLKY